MILLFNMFEVHVKFDNFLGEFENLDEVLQFITNCKTTTVNVHFHHQTQRYSQYPR